MAPNTSTLDPLAKQFVEKTLGSSQFEVIQLAGDASSRRYARVVHGEQSMVLMIWDPFNDDGKYPFLNVLAHFEKHGVLVPKVIAKAPTLGLVLLEDLGDLTLERKFWENQNQALALPYYKQAIDELIKIHYPASQDSKADCVAFRIAFDTEKLLWEMNYGREHLIEKLCQVKLKDGVRAEIDSIFVDICNTLDREEKLICHRDYHSRNVMIKLGKTRVIDFQDARMGSIQYDLVSLLHDSYVDLNDATRAAILEYYLSCASEYRTKPMNHDHFHSVFRIQMIQRCFKACGSFSSFYNMREDQRYLKYLGPTIKKVAQVLAQYPSYSTFLKVIEDNGLLEHDYLNPTGFRK
jgi:aminoglycoside/choline kinase family phosphotransferase